MINSSNPRMSLAIIVLIYRCPLLNKDLPQRAQTTFFQSLVHRDAVRPTPSYDTREIPANFFFILFTVQNK